MGRTRSSRGSGSLAGPSAADLIEALLDAHREGVGLVRHLLIAQELADVTMYEAEHANSRAAMAEARTRFAIAELEELQATEHWAQHVADVQRLLTVAQELLAPSGACCTEATREGVPRRAGRSRGHCHG